MNTQPTVPDLVQEARRGDMAAFQDLVLRHTAASLAYARALLGDARAEEAVQDAFLEAFQALHRLRDPAAFSGWLRRIVHKQCDRRMRRKSERPGLPPEVPAPNREEPDLDDQARWLAVRKEIDALPAHERVVVSLFHLGGVPVADIAAFLDLSIGSVKTRLSRARSRLRVALDAPVPTTASRLPLHDAVRLFLAVHAGDVATVCDVLDRDPAAIDREEDWSDELALAGGFSLAHPRTPLMLAASLGDRSLVEALLRRGADPSGRCTCNNGESALWVATRFGHNAVAQRLIEAGADDNVVHRRGIDLAALRQWRGTPPPTAWHENSGVVHTGVGAIDLWLRPHVHDVVRVTGAAETGLMVLLSELTAAIGASGGRAVWTSWVPHPWHVSELENIARRGGIEAFTTLVTPATRDLSGPEAVLPAGLAAVDGPGSVLHVVFEQPGHAIDLQPHLPALGSAATLTLVVRPWADVTADADLDDSWSGDGEITTSRAIAERGVWPAIDPERTRSKRPDDERTATARRCAADLDHPVVRALLQPFYTAYPDTGWHGEAWSRAALEERVRSACR